MLLLQSDVWIVFYQDKLVSFGANFITVFKVPNMDMADLFYIATGMIKNTLQKIVWWLSKLGYNKIVSLNFTYNVLSLFL